MATSVSARAWSYLSVVACAALALLLLWSQAWAQPGEPQYALLAVLAALAVLAVNFPLSISPRCKLDVSASVYFAAILLFGPPAAMLLVGVSQVVGGITLRMRRSPHALLKPRTAATISFNAGQLMLGNGLGSVACYAFLPHRAPAALDRVDALWAVPAAAVTIYLVNSAAVSMMAALELRENPLEIWLSGRPVEVMQYAGLLLVGLMTSAAATRYPWAPLLMVLPTAIIYISLKRALQLAQQTVAALEKMAQVVDRRDHYTSEHSARVAEYAEAVGRELGVRRRELEALKLAARVHDLGKIGVPDEILLKAGTLTDGEWEVMQGHVNIGYEILSQFPEYRRGRELVLSHHERFDGKGYPRGIAGHRLTLGAQIIAACDALDAMTSDRPYRPALPVAEAIQVLRRGKGTQWHPEVVEAVEAVLARRTVSAARHPAGSTQYAAVS
jgi:hypothetical protein